MRISASVVGSLLLWIASVAFADGPQDRLKELQKQYEQQGGAEALAEQFLELAQKHPADPAAVEALSWVLTHVKQGDAPRRAAEQLLERHAADARLVAICQSVSSLAVPHVEPFLRELAEQSEQRQVRAHATFELARHLQQQLQVADSLAQQPAFVRRFEQFYGKEMTRKLRTLDRARVAGEAESLLQQVLDQHASVDAALSEEAKRQLRELRHLAVGKPAQEIQGEDIFGEPFKLSDYRGRVVMLSFWGHW